MGASVPLEARTTFMHEKIHHCDREDGIQDNADGLDQV